MVSRADYATRSRERIAAVLRSGRRFFSAAEVHRELEAAGDSTSLSTVYRTLERLQAKGDVAVRLDEGGEAAYMVCEPERHHHHHAICRICGKVEDVACAVMDEFAQSLREQHGFLLDDHRLEFVGRCSACA